MGSTVIPPALSLTNLASKPRPLANRTATRFPFHSLGKYPANVPPLFAYILCASYPYMGPPGLETVKRCQARYKLGAGDRAGVGALIRPGPERA
jgi:hypothetical protein